MPDTGVKWCWITKNIGTILVAFQNHTILHPHNGCTKYLTCFIYIYMCVSVGFKCLCADFYFDQDIKTIMLQENNLCCIYSYDSPFQWRSLDTHFTGFKVLSTKSTGHICDPNLHIPIKSWQNIIFTNKGTPKIMYFTNKTKQPGLKETKIYEGCHFGVRNYFSCWCLADL